MDQGIIISLVCVIIQIIVLFIQVIILLRTLKNIKAYRETGQTSYLVENQKNNKYMFVLMTICIILLVVNLIF